MNHGRIRPRARQTASNCLKMACLGLALAVWLGCRPGQPPADSTPEGSGTAKSAPGTGQAALSAKETQPGAGEQLTAQGVLEAMAAAYKKASSYADGGQIVVQGRLGDKKFEDKWDFLLAVERPNKILLRSYLGILVSDGKQISAFIKEIPKQIAQREAPAELSLQSLYADHLLAAALTAAPPQTSAAIPPPLVLLLASDPLKTLLHRAEKTVLLPSEKIGENLCHRVQVQRQDGTGVYWIDQASHVLRRVEYPIESLKPLISGGPPESLSLVADFAGAGLGVQVDPKAFQFEVPPDARVARFFSPPDLALLGKPVPDFSFTDLEGKPVTPKSLAGKIAVIDLWATWCGWCRGSLAELQEVYKEFKGNDKVAFLAVSIDESGVDNKKLREAMTEWGVSIPVARDAQGGGAAFSAPPIPKTIALGADGTVQHCLTGAQPGAGVELAFKLKRLLDGEDVARFTLQQYDDFKQQYEQMLQQWVRNDVFVHSPLAESQMPRAKVLARTEPASLKMTRLWSCTKLNAPGNLLVVDRGNAPPRILALEEGKAIAEIGADGSLLGTTPLKLPKPAAMASLRAGTGPDGRHVFAAFNAKWPQIYLVDEKLQPLLTFPKDDENPRMGIGDVQLTSLSSDGPPLMVVGYWGIAGVQGVALDGTRQWADKSLVEVSRIAVLSPDAQGRRSLLCTNVDRGTLVLIDAQGRRSGEIKAPHRNLAWIAGADLGGNGQTELCALALEKDGNVLVLGLSAEGKESWSYPLPPGMHETAVERVVAGQVLPEGPGQWILPAADGTIHILTAEGRLLERFAYGASMNGLATTKLANQPVLLVATAQGVDAWQIEPAAKRP